MGFDDKDAPFFLPALTTVRIDVDVISHIAVNRILAMIKNGVEGETSLHWNPT